MCLWTDTGVWTLAVMIIKVIWHLNQPHFGDKASPVCTAHSRTKCPKGKQTSSLYLHSYTTPSPPPKLLLSTPWHFAKKRKKSFFFLRQLHSSLLPCPPSLPPSSTALWERGRGISLRKWRALERLESPVECSRVSGCTSGFLFLQADELIMEKWAWPQ